MFLNSDSHESFLWLDWQACGPAPILSVLGHNLVHDSVDVNGCERLKLVSLKESVEVRPSD
jgi:hypothetical protein